MTAYADELFRLVDNLCTADQVQGLLRTVKGQKDVRITAENKSDLIERNLRAAVGSRALSLDQVYELVRTAEENGNQHIFYFKPKGGRVSADSLKLESIARNLWGADWEKKMSFPDVKLKENRYIYADFRPWNPGQKPRDWMLKVYGNIKFDRFTGNEKQEGTRLYKEFVRDDLRVVLLARWNSPDLLELRVQRDESVRRVKSWVDQLWLKLGGALRQEDFLPWDLSKARRRMIDDEDKNKATYHFRDTRLQDSLSNRVSFETFATQGDLFASEEAKAAIRDILNGKDSKCTHLAAAWLPRNDGVPAQEYRTLLGNREPNEVIFSAHCTAKEIHCVTDKLRYFNR
jgi:hypothetical protein